MGRWAAEDGRKQRRGALALGALALVVLGGGVLVAQRQAVGVSARPVDDTLVLERVPARAHDPRQRALQLLERRVTANPGDERAAADLARACLEAARQEADPRYLGRAQAALAPWWGQAAPTSDDLLRLRAILKQSRHDFAGALADLDVLVARSPMDAQAQLVRAGVLNLGGKTAEAGRSCLAMAPVVSPLVLAACRAPIEAASDRWARAVADLQRALATTRTADGAEQALETAWGLSVLGELLYWAGELGPAEVELRRALALDPGDRYSRGVLADLLLDTGRAVQVRTLLDGQEADDSLLLRLAIAEARLGGPRAGALAQDLRARYAAERRRGDLVHGREEARFVLELERQPARALAVARENWAVQREPWDARVLLAAARAAGAATQAARMASEIEARGVGWTLAGGGPMRVSPEARR